MTLEPLALLVSKKILSIVAILENLCSHIQTDPPVVVAEWWFIISPVSLTEDIS